VRAFEKNALSVVANPGGRYKTSEALLVNSICADVLAGDLVGVTAIDRSTTICKLM